MGAAAPVLAVAVAAAWLGTSYLLMAHAPTFAWNGVVIVGPMLASLVVVGARKRWPLLAAPAALALLGLVWLAARGGGLSLEALYVAQHVTVHVALAGVFALSLGAGQESIITALARRVHGGHLTPAMAAYSRRVTIVWAAYFAAMAALSVGLFATLPFSAWAVFANLLTPAAIATLFIGEYVVRYRLHPEFERASLGDAMRAWKRRDTRDSTA
jgi:uncharacterized membrane protein